ncbi:hypothetical protein, partial [Nosocomiicoccus massiliensis]|uniref:hypothetical protein n=1 Tax=Nosocomiicoccus massiliensis TaxID=1232430 RepID=UPI000594EFD8
MELQLYFHNKEVELLPETVFEFLNSDQWFLNNINGLSRISYESNNENTRDEGTPFVVTYNGTDYKGKINKYVENRRLEITIFGYDYIIKTMINIVPVESRSEVVISSVLETH